MSKVLVSIVCTNYNKGDWITDAIESFLRQKVDFTYEIIIIDDKSTDHSPDIIREYAKKYPEKIRAFYNTKNLGITQTWIKVCKEAQGKYIARCDGDDYWIDDSKLQKQVELLKKNKDSLWCSTDYDTITPEGRVTHRSAFETGLVDKSMSYAEMLVSKLLTMSSTWLVDTHLMREVNVGMDKTAVDDTFNIQLDLFNKTKLTYLPEATAVYRLSDDSDSRPVDIEVIRSRNERLLKTQLEYVEKYKDTDYAEIIKLLLHRNMQNEMWATERMQIIKQQKYYIGQLEEMVKARDKQIIDIVNSKKYKVGQAIASPVSTVKSILKPGSK